MNYHTVRRTASVFLAVLRQEIQMIAQYRWWLLAMQASVIVIPLISLMAWRGAIAHGAQLRRGRVCTHCAEAHGSRQ